MTRRITRRGFGQVTAAGALGYFFAGPAWSIQKIAGANDRLRFAGVGIGGKGSSDIDHASEHGEIVALCDIDDKNIARKTAKWKDAKVFFDYRKLIMDEIMKNVDAVVVSTPDHHHATAALAAMMQGKHVYCQKPLTHTVHEARLMREVARKQRVCTQMGNQGTSENGLRRGVEIVQQGTIGDVKEVHIWTNRPVWPQAPQVTDKKMPKEAPCPKHVHWEEFIGPAPMRHYAQYEKDAWFGKVPTGAYHDFNWRGYWDFGTGAIGDMACHTANMAFMALKLAAPIKVSADATDVNPQSCPSSAHVTFEFAAREGMVPVTVHWYEGSKGGKLLGPPQELVTKALAVDPDPKRKQKLVNSGSIIVGSKGYIYSPSDYGAEVFLGPSESFASVQMKKPESLIPVSVSRPLAERKALQKKTDDKDVKEDDYDQRQKNEWIAAIRAGKPDIARSNFDYASALTETFLLGNVAIRSGKSFEYDPVTGKVKNCPEAEPFLTHAYRAGWELPG